MRSRNVVKNVLGTCLLLSAVGAMLIATRGEANGGPAIGNSGTQVAQLLPADLDSLRQIGSSATSAGLLGTSNERSFYKVGENCYGVGPEKGSPASSPERVLGRVVCNKSFPSADMPLLDFSVLHGVQGSDGNPTDLIVVRSEGFAADGISSVSLRDASGDIVATTAVVGNTYSFSSVVPQAKELVAVGRDGNQVATTPFG